MSVLLASACTDREPPPLPVSFYHWETEIDLSAAQRDLLAEHGADRLFIKAFDVVWEGEPVPAAAVRFGETAGLPALTPVVFVTQEVVAQLDASLTASLAADVVRFVEQLLPTKVDALQVDCDWTARTQVQYFELLSQIRTLRPGWELSCTLRLHQYRDRAAQGIPPVDRATLMAYNTGDLDQWETENSIVDATATRNYLAGQPRYPLPLDIAVAVYDWAAVYRHGRLVQLINEPDLAALADTNRFSPLAPHRYAVRRGTYLNGLFLYPEDLLRHEIAAPERIHGEARQIRRWTGPSAGQRLIVYRLGSRLWEGPVGEIRTE